MRYSLRAAAAAIVLAACTATAQGYTYFPEAGTLVFNSSEVAIARVEVVDSAGTALTVSPIAGETLEIQSANRWAEVTVTFVDGSEVQGTFDLWRTSSLFVSPESMTPFFFDDVDTFFKV
jgi:hypothetical protein